MMRCRMMTKASGRTKHCRGHAEAVGERAKHEMTKRGEGIDKRMAYAYNNEWKKNKEFFGAG